MREYFFKYTDPSTAEAILSNQTFRYSSPLKFNDPFDIQTDLEFDFEIKDLPEETMNVMERLIQSDTPLPNQNDPWAEAISLLREKIKIYGYRKDKIREITLPIFGYLSNELNHLITQLNSYWRMSMQESRVFCVTEKNDNLLMWAHYAKDHSGIVFQIATLPEEDTPLSAAKKVTYVKTPISFYSLEELIIWTLLGIEPDRSKFTYSNYAHLKSDIWSYEEEWRVVDMCHYSDKTEFHVDHPFIPEQIQKIFFGCKSEFEFRNNLISLTKKINPNAEFFLAKKRKAEYALDFERI